MFKLKSLVFSFFAIACSTLCFADSQYFTFIKSKSQPNSYITGVKLMDNLLTGNEDNFISEIECDSVQVKSDVPGIILGSIMAEGSHTNSSLKIYFNNDKLMKVNTITFYVLSYETEDPKLKLYVNGDQIEMPVLSRKDDFLRNSYATEKSITNPTLTTFWTTPDLSLSPMQELELKSTFINNLNDVQVLGFTVEYDGITKDIDTGAFLRFAGRV